MSDKSTIITVAMLSTYLQKRGSNYLDLLIPYLEILLPHKVNEIIDEESLQEKMLSRFSIQLPIYVIRQLLKKYKNTGNISKSHEHRIEKYKIVKIPNTEDFHKNYRCIEANIDLITTALEAYVNEKKIIKTRKEDLLNIFLDFLNHYGLSILNDTTLLNKISMKGEKKEFALIGRFIIEKNESEPEVFDRIVDIVKGFFVYKSIYYFYSDEKRTPDSKLKGTKVFLDARELINSLRLFTQEEYAAIWELINLVKNSGGEIAVFNHTIDEVSGILTKYAKDEKARLTMNLDFFGSNSYTEAQILRFRDSLEVKVRTIGIKIMETPTLNTTGYDMENLDDIGFFNREDFKTALNSEYEKSRNPPSDKNVEKDIMSIYGISMLRGSKRNTNIENCQAILASTNPYLVSVVKSYFQTRMKSEINFVIHDIDLTALLWLRDFNKYHDTPKHILLKNAYAALSPDNEILNDFLNNISVLEQEGTISKEEALAVRIDPTIKEIMIVRNVYELDKEESTNIVKEYFKDKFHEKDSLIGEIENQLKKANEELETTKNYSLNERKRRDKEDNTRIELRISNAYKNKINKLKFLFDFIYFSLTILILLLIFFEVTSKKYSHINIFNYFAYIYFILTSIFTIPLLKIRRKIINILEFRVKEYYRNKILSEEELIESSLQND